MTDPHYVPCAPDSVRSEADLLGFGNILAYASGKMRTFLLVLSTGWLTLSVPLPAANNYLQHNLVSVGSGSADHSDPSLVNPWGIAFSSSGPFWIANQGSAVASIYNSSGAASSAAVSVPTQPTGIVQNSTSDFPVAPGVPASFLFSSAAGTVSGWSSGTGAVVKIDRSTSGAIYTGLARASYATGSALYAVNFHAGTVEAYDGNFNLLTTSGSFQDPSIPAGFVPYNIWATGNKLYVTFAQQNSAKSGPVIAPGSGYVDLFDVNGSLVQQVAAGGSLNAPWGLAIASPKFGDFAGALLVGNFGEGTINAFDVTNSRSLGTLANVTGQTLSVPGLRALAVGTAAAPEIPAPSISPPRPATARASSGASRPHQSPTTTESSTPPATNSGWRRTRSSAYSATTSRPPRAPGRRPTLSTVNCRDRSTALESASAALPLTSPTSVPRN